MPPKAQKKNKKAPNEATAPPAFHAAMADYYKAKDDFNALKVKIWPYIPEDPPKDCPKHPLEKPWWTTDLEKQFAEMYPHIDISGKDNGAGGLDELFERLNMQDRQIKEGRQRKQAEKGETKDSKVDIDDLWIDEDLIVAAWTGEEGLVVPGGLSFPN